MRTARSSCLLFSLIGCDTPLSATGDQSVFAAIDVRIDSTEHDHPNYDVRIRPPPIEHGHSVYVTINGGTEAGRVSGLRVLANGEGLNEVGSAGLPQQFSYPFDQKHPATDPIVLEVLYRDARYPLRIGKLDGRIITPEGGAQVPATGALDIRWSGPELPASMVEVHGAHHGDAGTSPCSIGYRVSVTTPGMAQAHPEPRTPGQGPPCTGEVGVTWRTQAMPASPFKGLLIRSTLSRIQRYDIR